MNFQKTIEKITGFQLTNEQWTICLNLYLYGNTIYNDDETFDVNEKKLEEFKIIKIIHEKQIHILRCSLNENIKNKLDNLPLSYTNKNKWLACLTTLYPNTKINNTSHPNISFLSHKNKYQEKFIAYWSDTLKNGKIMHPYNAHDYNYNDFMKVIIEKEQLNLIILNDITEKQKTYKI